MRKHIVITGVGAVSPIGENSRQTLEGIRTGRKGIEEIKNFNTSFFPSSLGAEVKENVLVPEWNSAIDRKEIFLRKALDELMESCPCIEDYDPSRRIFNVGAGLDYFDLKGYANSEDMARSNWQIYSKDTYRIVEALVSDYKIAGGFTVNVTACVASAQAIGLSYRMLKNVDNSMIAISGGFDSMLNPLHYMGFYKLGAFSTWEGKPGDACKPFDKNRCGLVLGEGAIVFLLQSEEDAPPGSILAEIAGYSSTMDAYMVTDPDPNGRMLAKAALQAIDEADLLPDDIDCVHLHGTGTLKNEAAEYKAMEIIFSGRHGEIPVFSLKGQIGHLIGACGAMEMLGVIYSIQHQEVPPTVNFEKQDPEVPLYVIKDKPLKMNIRNILKLNSAFGGQNTAFVVKRYEK